MRRVVLMCRTRVYKTFKENLYLDVIVQNPYEKYGVNVKR